jgi:hypothetical protein
MLSTTSDIAHEWRRVAADLGNSILRTFPEHIPLYICALVFGVATLGIAHYFHAPLELAAGSFFLGIVLKFLCLGAALTALWELVALIRCGFPKSPSRVIAARIYARFFFGDRLGNIFHSLVAFTPLMVSFVALKEVIPQVHPFAWDHTLMLWGRWLGMGAMPWQLLQPVLGHPLITAALNLVYDSWFLVMFGGLFWQAFSAHGGVLRLQFLLAYSFAWFIAGNILATFFSSAGPCFYGFLHPNHNPYAAQMAYLHAAAAHWPVWSVGLQDLLWQSYVHHDGNLGGISAMPSMHITSTAVLAFAGWYTDRKLGFALWTYTALIVIGSIHLAWHYAMDGVAGLFLATVFWIAAGYVARLTFRIMARVRGKAIIPDGLTATAPLS